MANVKVSLEAILHTTWKGQRESARQKKWTFRSIFVHLRGTKNDALRLYWQVFYGCVTEEEEEAAYRLGFSAGATPTWSRINPYQHPLLFTCFQAGELVATGESLCETDFLFAGEGGTAHIRRSIPALAQVRNCSKPVV